MGRLDGKVVVMTGTSQGLGAETMKLFAREGAAVVGTARRENKVQEVIDELHKERDYPLLAMHHDVTSREDWDKVISAAIEKFGRIDILVNNAAQTIATDILSCTEEEVMNIFKTNVLSLVHGIQSVAPEFERQGQGVIVNVNSLASLVSGDADGGSAPYSIAKGAGRSLTKHAAYYLAEKNIRVNSIHPGPIMTPLLQKSLEENPAIASRVKEYNPLAPHISGPEDIANGILYLASDESRCVTGAELVVDCGHLTM